jgi:hypothetical protein
VEALPTQPALTNLAANVPADELGSLAHAIDGYQARLVEAEALERAFFADASHELRTPIAVVKGAVEVLADQDGLNEATLRRLHRIDRGVGELAELVDVLLRLVRREPLEPTEIEIEQLLRSGAEPVTASIHGKRLSVSIDARGQLVVPLREAQLILHGVIRRLLPPAPVGTLSLVSADGKIEIRFRAGDEPRDDTAKRAPARSDRGLGLTLVGRLAARIGWRLDEASASGGDRVVRIVLPDCPDSV